MNEKIKPCHLERKAFVYVRQSSRHQVRHHREGQQRQYGLVDHARGLGFRDVVVIDEDLGRSGSGKIERRGFDRLVAFVCRGEAGAVLAMEGSRLARNNRDWHYLIDFCALTETLVIDYDGIYDPRLINDRLLLGLKGTMSEFELSLLRQRAQEALRQKIARGEILTEVPVGYIRTESNRIEMTPDLQVQEAIRGVFAKFGALGSVRQVLLWYREQELPLPTVRPATRGKEVRWQLPTYPQVLAILKNPVYAGVFVYGRRRTKRIVTEEGKRKTQSHEVPREEWAFLIPDHHLGYISWEEFLRNEVQLKENAVMSGRMSRGAPKRGPALLAGLFRCGRCGQKLHVAYSGSPGRVARYACRGGHINHGVSRCISFGALRVERAVVAQVLEAIQPAFVKAALEAQREITRQSSEKRRALQLALEKARYEANYARRQYEAVDPENRLVAGELEKRWEEALQREREMERKLEKLIVERECISAEERRRLLVLGKDLEQVWDHPGAPIQLKKRILRTVLDEIVVDVSEEDSKIVFILHWVGGVHTRLEVPKNRAGQHRRCTDRQVVELVGELAKVCDDWAITALLNRLGYRTGAGNTWTETRVRSLRSYHQIPAFDASTEREWLTLGGSAKLLEVSPTVIRRLLKQGILPGRQVVSCAPWIIQRRDLDLPEVREAVEAVHDGRRVPQTRCEKAQIRLFSRE